MLQLRLHAIHMDIYTITYLDLRGVYTKYDTRDLILASIVLVHIFIDHHIY